MKPEGQRQCFLELHTPPFRQVSGQTTEENERERGEGSGGASMNQITGGKNEQQKNTVI